MNAIRRIDQRFAFKNSKFSYFVSGLDIQLEKPDYDSPVRKKNQLQVAKYDESYCFFRLIDTNQSLSGQVVESLAIWVQFLKSAEASCSALTILRGTEPLSALTRLDKVLSKFCPRFLSFLRLMSCLKALGKEMWEEKLFQFLFLSNAIICIDKGLRSRTLIHHVWA